LQESVEVDDSITAEGKSKDQENGARSWRVISMTSICVGRLRRRFNLWSHCSTDVDGGNTKRDDEEK